MGLTQEEFATKVEMSRITLSGIERGTPASIDSVTKICTAFEITKEQLLSYGATKSSTDNPWKDALVAQLKNEVETHKQTIEFLKSLIPRPAQANFLNPSVVARSLWTVDIQGDTQQAAA
jgi:transcriptional regulator with XRE-family HTH domain